MNKSKEVIKNIMSKLHGKERENQIRDAEDYGD